MLVTSGFVAKQVMKKLDFQSFFLDFGIVHKGSWTCNIIPFSKY